MTVHLTSSGWCPGPGEYSNDEASSGGEEDSGSPTNKESSSDEEEEPKKEAGGSCSGGEEDSGSPSNKESSSDEEEEPKEEAGEPSSGDGPPLEEKNEYKIRWKGHGPGEDTWELEEALCCVELVEVFWQQRRVYLDPGLGGDPDDDPGYGSDDSEAEVAAHFAEPILLRCCRLKGVALCRC